MSPRLTFALPLVCLLYGIAAAILLIGSWFGFDLLRFTQCPAWTKWPPPPQPAAALLGDQGGRVYLQSANGDIFCSDGKTWEKCGQPVYGYRPAFAPAWLTPRLILPESTGIRQLLRLGQWHEVTYIALSAEGKIWACPVTFDGEVLQMAQSGLALWAFLPLLAGLFCFWMFVLIATREARPFLWDWWGHGTEIK